MLQQRIGRKNLTKKILADAPVSFMAYDLLEQDGRRRARAAAARAPRAAGALLAGTGFMVSPVERAASWLEFADRRAVAPAGVEGFMLKRLDAAYGTGRTKAEGLWWKWKIDPHDRRLRAGLRAAGAWPPLLPAHGLHLRRVEPAAGRQGGGRRGAGRHGAQGAAPARALQLVPFAKAYSGLTDEEFRQVDGIIRKSTVEKFGLVRSVKPSLVFELGFEGINRSGRHRSGIAVRFPRMLRIRHDKPLHEADSLQELERLLGS